jgi:hypothetical protein
MNLLEVYKSNYSYVSLKEKGYTIEKFLSETCKYFFNKQLFPKIEKRFLDNKVPNSKIILEKIKNISKVEENSITISPSEIADIINFSIFMERDQMIQENLSKKEFKISKISDVLVNGIEEEIYENEEKDYSEDQIKQFIIKTSKEITNDVSEKNGNIIITFS